MAVAATKDQESQESQASKKTLPMTALVQQVSQKSPNLDPFESRESSPSKTRISLRYSHSHGGGSEADRVSTASSHLPSLYNDTESVTKDEKLWSQKSSKQRTFSDSKSDVSGFSFKGLPFLDNVSMKSEERSIKTPLTKHESVEALGIDNQLVHSIADILSNPPVEPQSATSSAKDFGYHSQDSVTSSMDLIKKGIVNQPDATTPFRLKMGLNRSMTNLEYTEEVRSQSVDNLSERIVGGNSCLRNNKVLFIDPFNRQGSKASPRAETDTKKDPSNRLLSESARSLGLATTRVKQKQRFIKYDTPIKPSFRLRPNPSGSHANDKQVKDSPKVFTPRDRALSLKPGDLSEREKSEVHSMKAIKSCLTAKNFSTNIKADVPTVPTDTPRPSGRNERLRVRKMRNMFGVRPKMKEIPASNSGSNTSFGITKSCNFPRRQSLPAKPRCDSSMRIGSYITKPTSYKTSNMAKGEYFKTDARIPAALDSSIKQSTESQDYQNAKHSELYCDMLDMNRIVKGKTTARKKPREDQPRMYKMKIGQQNVIVVDHNRTTPKPHRPCNFQIQNGRNTTSSPVSDSQWVPPNTPHYDEIYKGFDQLADDDDEERAWNVKHLNISEDVYPIVIKNRFEDEDEETEEQETEKQESPELEMPEKELNETIDTSPPREEIHVHVPIMPPSTPATPDVRPGSVRAE